MTTDIESAGDCQPSEPEEHLVHILDANEAAYDASVQIFTRVTYTGDDGQPVTVAFENTPTVRIFESTATAWVIDPEAE